MHGYDFNRMVVELTMVVQGRVIPRAISTAAMDGPRSRPWPVARAAYRSFMRLC